MPLHYNLNQAIHNNIMIKLQLNQYRSRYIKIKKDIPIYRTYLYLFNLV